jgi:hypothetical protein
MDWLEKEMESLIERCRLDSVSAELVKQALIRAASMRSPDMRNLYISYCNAEDQINALRIQTLANVTGRFVTFVPPKNTRLHLGKLDAGSKCFLKKTDYLLTIGNHDRSPHKVCNEEFRMTSGSKVAHIVIDFDTLKTKEAIYAAFGHQVDWPNVDWYPMRGVCYMAFGLLMMTMPEENFRQ